MRLYEKLRTRMADRGYTGYLLSEYLGEGSQYVKTRLNRYVDWSANDMYRIMRLLEIPFEEMHLYFTEDGKPAKESKKDDSAQRILQVIAKVLEEAI